MSPFKFLTLVIVSVSISITVQAHDIFNGLDTNLDNLYKLSDAETRPVSLENPTGEKGKSGMATLEEGTAADAARDLGQGWKVNPFINIEAGETYTIAEMEGPGAVKQMWMTPTDNWRFAIMRIYWDGEEEPSVEVPLGDFFGVGWGEHHQISSLPIGVNPGSSFNSHWVMPFREDAKITIENIAEEPMRLFYQINYSLTDVPDDAAYFHAQFRRINPLPYKEVYTIIDDIEGQGHYVETSIAWQSNSNSWWGKGEIKFYMDGDTELPTINGTGTEDYFLGSFGFWIRNKDGDPRYKEFTSPYAGFYVIEPNLPIRSQTRFGMYRWHLADPIRFKEDLRVTIQALGSIGGRYVPLQDDIASVAYWYQAEPHTPFPELPSKDKFAVN